MRKKSVKWETETRIYANLGGSRNKFTVLLEKTAVATATGLRLSIYIYIYIYHVTNYAIFDSFVLTKYYL